MKSLESAVFMIVGASLTACSLDLNPGVQAQAVVNRVKPRSLSGRISEDFDADQYLLSPDSKMLAYEVRASGLSQSPPGRFDTVALDGSFKGHIVDLPYGQTIRRLQFTPDSAHIVYLNGDLQLFSVNPDGTHLVQLSSESVSTFQVTQDSGRVVFGDLGSGVHSVRIDGTDPQALGQRLRVEPDDHAFDVVANGRVIFYKKDLSGNEGFYSINADGTGLVLAVHAALPTPLDDSKNSLTFRVSGDGSRIYAAVLGFPQTVLYSAEIGGEKFVEVERFKPVLGESGFPQLTLTPVPGGKDVFYSQAMKHTFFEDNSDTVRTFQSQTGSMQIAEVNPVYWFQLASDGLSLLCGEKDPNAKNSDGSTDSYAENVVGIDVRTGATHPLIKTTLFGAADLPQLIPGTSEMYYFLKSSAFDMNPTTEVHLARLDGSLDRIAATIPDYVVVESSQIQNGGSSLVYYESSSPSKAGGIYLIPLK